MQKFRGFSPRTRFARWGLLAVALGMVLGSTAPAAFDQVGRAIATQHDNLPWYGSRLLAFLAYLAIAGSVVYGLLLSTGILDAFAHRPISFTLHQDLSAIGLGLAVVHAVLLSLDRAVPFPVASLLVPFASPYQPFWVGLGQVALILTIVVVASFSVRRRIGQRAWRLLHYLTFLVFLGTTAHGLMAGTDSGTIWAWAMYAGASMAVGVLLAVRIARSVAARRAGRALQRPVRTATPADASGTAG